MSARVDGEARPTVDYPDRTAPLLSIGGAVVFSVIIVILAAISAMAAYANSFGRLTPEVARNLWPANGFVLAELADMEMGRLINPDTKAIPSELPADIRDLSERAIRLEPMAVAAIRDLAYFYQGHGESGLTRARLLMRQAAALTRRDSVVNLWLADDYFRQNQSRPALMLYDATLRTSTFAASLLLPRMAAALRDPRAPTDFEMLLRENPPWHDSFWAAVIQDGTALRNAYVLRERLHKLGTPMPSLHDALLIQQLAAAHMFSEAFDLFAVASGRSEKTDGEMLQNADFRRVSQFEPIDWRLISEGRYGAELDQERHVLAVSALPRAVGTVAQQLAYLPQGEYTVDVRYSNQGKAGPKPLALQASCAELNGARTFERTIPLPQSGEWRLRQDTFCRYVWISLRLSPEEAGQGFDVEIERLSIKSPAR